MMLQWEQYVQWRSITEIHASHSTLWCPGGLRRVFPTIFLVSVLLCCQDCLRAHHMEICVKQSLSRPMQYIQPCSTLLDVHASAHTHIDTHTHTHTHTHTSSRRGHAEDHWTVKWFCYHVVCVEYIFPSTLSGRCADGLPVLCVGVCILWLSVCLSLGGRSFELGVSIKTSWQCQSSFCSSHSILVFDMKKFIC